MATGVVDRAGDPGAGGWFYRGLDRGSDAVFHPVSELVSGAFGILQVSSRWKPLAEIDWANGLDVTWRSVSHPISTVRTFGVARFIRSEIVPGRLAWRDLQYVPNYSLHLIGGGARHRAFVEWYRAHGVPAPGAMAWLTTALHAVLVESVEHESESLPTVDPVADMLVFDPAGALLFSSDRVARFFARTLHFAIWSGQPMFDLVHGTVENAGQNYALHYFRGDSRVGVFSYWGMSHLLGVTVRRSDGWGLSVGLGGAVNELRSDPTRTPGSFYARIAWDAGVFLHWHGSLMASVHASQAWTQRLRVNVYPGLVRVGRFSPGLFLGIRGGGAIAGLRLGTLPVGLAWAGRGAR